MFRWGIDLGGTKIECAVLSEQNVVVFRARLPTESEHGYAHILNQIKRLIDRAKAETNHQPEWIGMCTPGSIDKHTRLLKNSNTVCMNGMPFLKDIQQKLETAVLIENDGNCLALAEYHMGVVPTKFPEARVLFGVILGTGVGGGIVVNGKLLTGPNHIAGEWGHNFLASTDAPCYCGKLGCVETFISGPALERFYTQQSGIVLSLKKVFTLASTSEDQHAVATLDRLIKYFGLSISGVINILDPDVIVIGGGVGNADELYNRGAEEAKKHVFNPTCVTRFSKAVLGDSSGVFGAAFIQ